MPDAIFVGNIGSASPELSKFILDDSDIIFQVKKIMEGCKLTVNDQGEIAFEKGGGKVYNDKCISFVLSSLSQTLNKNLKLSNYDKTEHKATAWSMCDDFLLNLLLNMRDFEIESQDISMLSSMYRNYVDQAIRRPLNESDKRFLSTTTQEQTLRQKQDISQSSSRGIVGSIFGGKNDG